MSYESVKGYFEHAGLGDRLMLLEHSSATVGEAAEAIGCEPRQIAKTLSFLADGCALLIVVAGDARVDNQKYRETFRTKAKMIPADEVEHFIGHAPGGVCPFVIHTGVRVYLDVSLRRFPIVYPAAGSDHSAVRLTPEELERLSHAAGWVDVCRGWQQTQA